MVDVLVLKPKTTNKRNTITRPKRNDETIQVTKQDLMRMLTEDDAMKSLLQTLLQEVLGAEMEEALRAGKNERTSGRLGYAIAAGTMGAAVEAGEVPTGPGC